MSFAILKSEAAIVFRTPENSTIASCAASAENLLGAVMNGSAVSAAISRVLAATASVASEALTARSACVTSRRAWRLVSLSCSLAMRVSALRCSRVP